MDFASDRQHDDNTLGHSEFQPRTLASAAKSEPGSTYTAMPESLDEAAVLKDLTSNIRDQDDLERDITSQANAVLLEAEDKKDQARIDKLKVGLARLVSQRKTAHDLLVRSAHLPTQSRKHADEVAKLDRRIKETEHEVGEFEARLAKRQRDAGAAAAPGAGGDGATPKAKSRRLPGESHREYLIRTGKITPFANIGGERPDGPRGQLADAILEAEEEAVEEQMEQDESGPVSHQILRMPGFTEAPTVVVSSDSASAGAQAEFGTRPRKKRRVRAAGLDDEYDDSRETSRDTTPLSMMAVDDGEAEDSDRPRRRKGKKKAGSDQGGAGLEKIDLSRIDDGDESNFRKRLADWVGRRSRARQARQHIDGEAEDVGGDDDDKEWLRPAPDNESWDVNERLRIPGDIHPSLFGYQKTGVQWLAELYNQKTGGIIADEMGLGKTVQIIAFVSALHHSGLLKKPVIVVAPATVLQQWVTEFHRWWPPLRVSILHASGSGMLNLKNEYDDEMDRRRDDLAGRRSAPAAREMVDRVVKHGHVLVTTYTGLHIYADELLDVKWAYAVLDEGHKIRNPNAEVTITCKELNTPHRIILSGTPVQNNLCELWSLFDFIYPMRLGTLVNFRTQFETPIKQGGYANASALQIMTAERCAETLKGTISRYLLQRLKVDVAADLPEKTEQVLFCKLTPHQLDAYARYLSSDAVSSIIAGHRRSLAGIDTLRKICNHPDLLQPQLKNESGYEWASLEKSGKLQVVNSLVRIWKRFGHKTLLFSQGKLMLNIIETFLKKTMLDVNYLRMDGETQVEQRQIMIDRFNSDPDIHVFLLTTRTGGLGVNLTGADRIIIFDPDWNPSTDMQARERAWRLGQTKPVSIYRLMTNGTIEEKIYRRQIFKQFMTSKVLHDPKQRAAFDLSDLYDLFAPPTTTEAERGALFHKAQVKFDSGASGPGPGSANANAMQSQRDPVSSNNGNDPDAEEQTSLSTLSNLAVTEEFKEDPKIHDEKRMIEGIFSRTVDSAYEHDQIVLPNGRPKIQADRAALAAEAKRVAASAAAHLRRSEEEAQALPIGTVTWTGEMGIGGRPGGGAGPGNTRRGRGGPGSSALLAPGMAAAGLQRSTLAANANATGLRSTDFEKMVADFINRQGGRAPSKMLVDHFNRYCPTKMQSDEFKRALDNVARLGKTGGAGRGIWTLK